MEKSVLHRPGIMGREEELGRLKQFLEDAISGKGSTTFISGEAGIGKTRLIEEFRKYSGARDVNLLFSVAAADTVHPFLIFSKALENVMDRPLFHEQEHTTFAEIFAVDTSGLLIAKAIPEKDGLDADIFAGMLTAVQSFVRDSFGSTGEQTGGLGRLEYGNMKILIEHGEHLFLTAVFRGAEHPGMKELMRRTVRSIEEKYSEILETWSGKMGDVIPIQKEISALAKAKFLVRRDLEGVKLENERLRIADQVLEIFVDMAKAKPLLLILEDLHWADESSLFVLNYLARNVRKESIMILCTLRPGESEMLQKTIREMIEEDTVNEMNLEILGNDSVTSLINDIYSPNDFSLDFLENISSQCEGNPFFVIEVLRQMNEEGSIAKQDDKYVLVREDYTIPSTVEDVVHRRLEMLEPDAMAMAEYVSCIGRVFDHSAAHSIQLLRDASFALEKLQANGILIATNGKAEFTHAIFQDVIYLGIGNRWKSIYHKSLGEYYEEAYVDRSDEVLYDLARHFSRSNEHTKAFDYCIRAGEKAENAYAPEQAMEFYNQAIACFRKGNEQISEIEIYERMGSLNILVGRLDEALESYSKILEHSENNVICARVLRKSSDVYLRKGEWSKTLEMLEEAKGVLGDPGDIEYVRILIHIVHAHRRRGEFEKAFKILTEVENALKEHTDPKREMLMIYSVKGLIDWRAGRLSDALLNLQKAYEIATELGEEKEIASVEANLGNVYNYQGNMENAMEYYRRSLESFKKFGDIQSQTILLNNIGNVHSDTGNLTTALEYYRKCLGIRKRIGDKKGLAYTHNNIGNQLKFMGQFKEALEHCKESYDILKTIGDRVALPIAMNNIADIYRYLGQSETAKKYHEMIIELTMETGNKKAEVTTRCDRAEVLLEEGNNAEAHDEITLSMSLAEETGAVFEMGVCHKVKGMYLWSEGRHSEACQEFGKAEDIFSDMNNERELARVNYEYGILLGNTKKQDEATERLQNALKIFDSIGMSYWAEKCQKALEELDE